jgi:antitoxin component YwqK of YwqJK toxin-antitoxin module
MDFRLFAINVCIFDFLSEISSKKKTFIGGVMKKISVMIVIASLLLITGNCILMACTTFNATQMGITLVGNNEDGTDPITYVWFLPAEKSKYGRVYFGLSNKWPQGGMNDQGLFYDGTACPLLEVKKSKDKPIYNGNLSEKILEECSTVDEALELLGKYNLNYFRNGEMMIVDKFGNSVIVEGDTIIRKQGHYQVVTNFYQSKPSLGGYPCSRYDIAGLLLKKMERISVDYFRNVLDAVHTKGYTQYSNICDLSKGIIYLFRDSNYQECVKLDLHEELKKGKNFYALSSLFSSRAIQYEMTDRQIRYTGKYRDFYDNGNIKTEISLENGKLNGKCCGYYQNGQISWRRNYDQNKLVQFWRQWNENGKQTLDIEVSDGYIRKATEFYPSGEKLFELTFKKIQLDKIVVWNENGTENYSGFYKNGLFYLNGEAKSFTGDLVTYYENRQKHKKRTFKNGKKDGIFIEWDKNGLKIKEEIFKDNVLLKVNRYR